MTLDFVQEKPKSVKYLAIILIVLVSIVLIIFFKDFFENKDESSSIQVKPNIRNIEIDFTVLNHPFLQEIESFEGILFPDDIEIGRENPFLPR